MGSEAFPGMECLANGGNGLHGVAALNPLTMD